MPGIKAENTTAGQILHLDHSTLVKEVHMAEKYMKLTNTNVLPTTPYWTKIVSNYEVDPKTFKANHGCFELNYLLKKNDIYVSLSKYCGPFLPPIKQPHVPVPEPISGILIGIGLVFALVYRKLWNN